MQVRLEQVLDVVVVGGLQTHEPVAILPFRSNDSKTAVLYLLVSYAGQEMSDEAPDEPTMGYTENSLLSLRGALANGFQQLQVSAKELFVGFGMVVHFFSGYAQVLCDDCLRLFASRVDVKPLANAEVDLTKSLLVHYVRRGGVSRLGHDQLAGPAGSAEVRAVHGIEGHVLQGLPRQQSPEDAFVGERVVGTLALANLVSVAGGLAVPDEVDEGVARGQGGGGGLAQGDDGLQRSGHRLGEDGQQSGDQRTHRERQIGREAGVGGR